MENQLLIEIFERELRRMKSDVRAETLFALAVDLGMSPDDLLVGFDKLFFREYSKDILSADIKEDANRKSLLQVHLTRGGIYDLLPEGLFFQPSEASARQQSAAEMAIDYQANKKKEESIRRFFMPLENDLFLQRIQIEQEESRLLEGLQAGMLNDYFVRFWGLPASVAKECVVPLLILLPHAYKIAGNLALTGQCLQQLLQEEAVVRQISSGISELPQECIGLGDFQLGVDMTCGSQFHEDFPVLECVIGPLVGSRLQDYLAGGRRWSLMETFYRFFIPAGVDVKLTVLLPEERQHMVLRAGQEPLLGYSSVL